MLRIRKFDFGLVWPQHTIPIVLQKHGEVQPLYYFRFILSLVYLIHGSPAITNSLGNPLVTPNVHSCVKQDPLCLIYICTEFTDILDYRSKSWGGTVV